jgi:hypothetical protein
MAAVSRAGKVTLIRKSAQIIHLRPTLNQRRISDGG